jgi:polysaccharide deacetylase family protein (PEP-CTERM system associated)
MPTKNKPTLAFSIDFEGFVEGMEQSFDIPDHISRYEIENELQSNLNFCLDFLDSYKIQSTFFILGWIGKKFPKMVSTISDHGHEIACHSLYHKRLSDLSISEIKQDLYESKKILEDASGKEVIGFRAPDFSIPQNIGIIDYLLKIGYKYDSSLVFTNVHDVYKGPKVESDIFYYENGLIEFPISNISFYNIFSVPVGGGGYLRLYPNWITKYFLKIHKSPILYLHPYELGGNYPRELKMNAYRRFRHTYNINKVPEKTAEIVRDFDSISIKTYLENKGYFD